MRKFLAVATAAALLAPASPAMAIGRSSVSVHTSHTTVSRPAPPRPAPRPVPRPAVRRPYRPGIAPANRRPFQRRPAHRPVVVVPGAAATRGHRHHSHTAAKVLLFILGIVVIVALIALAVWLFSNRRRRV